MELFGEHGVLGLIFRLFTNPAKALEISAVDVSGKPIAVRKVGYQKKESFDLRTSKGWYLLRITTTQGVIHQKLIVH